MENEEYMLKEPDEDYDAAHMCRRLIPQINKLKNMAVNMNDRSYLEDEDARRLVDLILEL